MGTCNELLMIDPMVVDQGLDQVQSIVETNLASAQQLGGAKAVADYNTAYVLHTAPILLIGTAISTAVFPRLNARLSQGRPDLFRQDFLRTLQLIIWIILPVVVISFFGRGYLARLERARRNSGWCCPRRTRQRARCSRAGLRRVRCLPVRG
jgi:peptidoglycan biosynthesis protein MviN/MurJ (putative lipid II flippase)